MSSLVLALDIGTSSVRCSAYDETGTYVASSRHVQMYRAAADGTLPLTTVTQASEAVVDGCLHALRSLQRNHQAVAVGISSIAMSWLGIDAAGRPLTPIYTYACRHGAQAASDLRRQLQQDGAADRIHATGGVPLHTAYAPAQLLGLAATNPGVLQAVTWWQTLGAYLLSRWLGPIPAPISTSEAGWTGLLDRARSTWHDELLAYLPITAQYLPPLQDYAQGLVGLRPEWRARWPELHRCPFFLPVGDGAAANIGSGALDSRFLAVTVGTSAAVRVVLTETEGQIPAVPTGLWGYRVDRTRHLLGGALTDGGSLVRWIYDFLGSGQEDLTRAAAEVGPDGHGLTLLPFLHGERSPGWADNATLAVQGITGRTRPAHLMRAGMEAVTFRLALIAERLRARLADDAPIVASGGALESSALWRQIIADVLVREVRLLKATETASRGAALLAWQALGRTRALEPHLPLADTAFPDPACRTRYAEALARHQTFYDRLY